MSSSVFVVAYRRAGSNQPALRPSGTTIIDYRHDGDGGTHTLYEFTDADMAAGFTDLVKGEIFTTKRKATRAFKGAIGE
jgi:hypothetical protein